MCLHQNTRAQTAETFGLMFERKVLDVKRPVVVMDLLRLFIAYVKLRIFFSPNWARLMSAIAVAVLRGLHGTSKAIKRRSARLCWHACIRALRKRPYVCSSSKRVSSEANLNRTTPVGPFLCLLMSTSAMPTSLLSLL